MKTLLPTLILLAAAMNAMAQRTILGRHTDDRVLPAFWSQQSNASNTVSGLSAQAPANSISDRILPLMLSDHTFSNSTGVGTHTFNSGTTIKLLSNVVIRLGTNVSLIVSNGAVVTDDTGARTWNFKLTPDSNTVTRTIDVTNAVNAMDAAAGRWISLNMVDTNQFSTNGAVMKIKDGASTTNGHGYSRFSFHGSQAIAVAAKTTNYSLASDDYLILASASTNLVLTLPAASTTNVLYGIKNTGTNQITIARAGADIIDGAASLVLSNQYQFVWLVGNSSNWMIIGQ